MLHFFLHRFPIRDRCKKCSNRRKPGKVGQGREVMQAGRCGSTIKGGVGRMHANREPMPIGERSEYGASLQLEHFTVPGAPPEFEDRFRTIRHLTTKPERRRKGDATYLLAKVCVEADHALTTLILDAVPFDESPLDEQALMLFYRRFGFRLIDDTINTMIREPRVGRALAN